MNHELKAQLARLLNYVMHCEEMHFEEVIDHYGVGSDQAENHIYTLARNIWCELEMDITKETT